VGVYALATDNIVVVPSWVPPKKAERIAEWLKVRLIHTTMGCSSLIGALSCANSNGILLPNFIREDECDAVRGVFKGNVTIMETKKNAYGNMVLANDYGAAVDPHFKDEEVKAIARTLEVETVRTEIAGLPYVGSLATATNRGVVAHPLLKDSEKELLEKLFKVPVDLGTVNCGIPYVGTGMIANAHAAVAGNLTTGPEMFIIGNALDVVQEEEELESFQSNG